MFSKTCQYGIKAIIYIAKQSLENKRVKAIDIVKHTGTPKLFTAKILGDLTKYGIVDSVKGPQGGFEIDKTKMKEIMVSQIVYALDGDNVYNGCALGLSECNANEPCPMHNKFVKVRNDLKKMLTTTSIYSLANDLKLGKSFLLR